LAVDHVFVVVGVALELDAEILILTHGGQHVVGPHTGFVEYVFLEDGFAFGQVEPCEHAHQFDEQLGQAVRPVFKLAPGQVDELVLVDLVGRRNVL